jgi:hypothetical protein
VRAQAEEEAEEEAGRKQRKQQVAGAKGGATAGNFQSGTPVAPPDRVPTPGTDLLQLHHPHHHRVWGAAGAGETDLTARRGGQGFERSRLGCLPVEVSGHSHPEGATAVGGGRAVSQDHDQQLPAGAGMHVEEATSSHDGAVASNNGVVGYAAGRPVADAAAAAAATASAATTATTAATVASAGAGYMARLPKRVAAAIQALDGRFQFMWGIYRCVDAAASMGARARGVAAAESVFLVLEGSQ